MAPRSDDPADADGTTRASDAGERGTRSDGDRPDEEDGARPDEEDGARPDEEDGDEARPDEEAGRRAREVAVPLRLYKVVTVFSTLFAVAFVVGGFVVLDAATRRARLSVSEMNLPLAVVGVGMIAAGAVVYAFATRFRAEGMGKPKDDADERSDNG